MLVSRSTIYMCMAVFGLQPLALGVWFALIPEVKTALSLSKADLALALLGMPFALIPALQLASRMISRFGPRRILMIGFPLQALAFTLPLMAGSQAQLFAALAVNGVILAFMEAALNVYAGRLEKGAGVVVMNRCHGFWALGLMGGALAVTVLGGLFWVTTMVLVSVPSAIAGLWVAAALPRLPGADEGVVPPRRALRALPPALFLISAFALIIAMTEGAMSDWAAVYLAERLPEGASGAGVAVSIYAGFLALGRFAGDAAKVRFGSVGLARATVGCAIAGLLCLVLPLPLAFAYLGFAMVGVGASVGFPLGVSAVAALDDRYEGPNIALMSSMAICGFLIGPPLIGFVADGFGLRAGLGILIPLLCVAWVFSGQLRPRVGTESG